jgi:hypothetical protein
MIDGLKDWDTRLKTHEYLQNKFLIGFLVPFNF